MHEEEVGPEVLYLDTHPVTCALGVPTRHLDVRFLVRAGRGAQSVRSDESVGQRWWPVDALPEPAYRDTVSEQVRQRDHRVSTL